MAPSHMKQRISARGPQFGCWIEMFSPIAAEVVENVTAIARVEEAAKAAGTGLGAIPTPERSAADLVAAGYELIIVDADVLLLRDRAQASLARLRTEI